MAAEEVVLRREKLPEHGPRLRGQSTYLALLSSLATDLDIMLSDLRNSHNSSQPLNTSANHPLHQRLSNHTASGNSSHCTTGFLQSSLRDSSSANYPPQQHSIHLIPATAAASSSSYHSRYQPHNSTTPSYCDIQNHKPPTLTGGATDAEDHWQPGATADGDAAAAASDDVFAATPGHGLLEASKQIQKLPLWSYQHKQLQQPPPQKIHNKVAAKTGLPADSGDLKCHQCNPQARNRGGKVYSNNRRNQSINKWLAQAQRPLPHIYGLDGQVKDGLNQPGERRCNPNKPETHWKMSGDLCNVAVDKSKVEVLVPAKSDKTLRNNINSKDESVRKRTSLNFVPHQHAAATTPPPPTWDDLNDSAIDCDNGNEISAPHPVYGAAKRPIPAGNLLAHDNETGDAEGDKAYNNNNNHQHQHHHDNDNSNCMMESVGDSCDSGSTCHYTTTDAETSSSSTSSPSEVEDDDDNNGGTKCRMTNSSSASPCLDDECALKNFLNEGKGGGCSDVDEANILDVDDRDVRPPPIPAKLPACDTLLSPQEAPMGRRYAEVAQFKNAAAASKRNSTDSQNHAINSTANTSASAPNQFASATSGAAIPTTADTQRRLPFCGLDSSKGSDNNGETTAATPMQGGKTNLSFDLTDNGVASAHGPGSLGAGGNFPLNGTDPLEQFHSLDASNESVVSCDADDGQFEDDTQALLPPKSTGNRNSSNHGRSLYKDELSQSRTSLVSSSDGGILAEGETSSETSRGSDDCPPCDLGLVERLLLTHPVWFLPSIQRSGAVHFLQGKEEGNFIVRGSSQKNTMAVSVRLPPHTGPYIEHYLIQSIDGILSLESSRFKFDSIPTLIAHYAQCCDELPVQLALPRALCETNNRQQLSSLALLGQEFWRYPMSCPKSADKSNETGAATQLGVDSDVKSPNSITETSGLGTMLFSNQSNATAGPKTRAPSQFFGAVSPSDTTSSMSSFTTSGGQHMQLMSPESVDSIILTMSPVDANNARNLPLGSSGFSSEFTPSGVNGLSNNLSTFKSNAGAPATASSAMNKFKNNIDSGEFGGNSVLGRVQRPQPPNTLNLDLRKPPAPPMRWTKPMSPNSPLLSTAAEHANFTVTTTVTFSTNSQNSQFVEVTTPAAVTPAAGLTQNNATFQTFAKRLSPEGECKDTLSSQGSLSNGSKWASQSSKDSSNSQRKILTPVTVGTPTSAFGGSGGKSRKSKARKESKHYQESDILESPQIYCQSALGDKISDYEDLWSNDPSDRTGLLSSFKPVDSKRPDLLAETPTSNSLSSSANQEAPPAKDPHSATDTAQLLPYTDEAPARSRNGLLLPSLMSQSLSEDQLKGCIKAPEGDATPTPQSPAGRSKQGSPFYAEPADALRQATASILRRSQRGPLLPANHRHSEPPKGGLPRTPLCPLLLPPEPDKMAGSLDELKKKQQQQQQNAKRNRSRLEQWQLDSSWEFMGNNKDQQGDDEDGDYDSDDMFAKQQRFTAHADKENDEAGGGGGGKKRPITIHQIIAKRLPNLNLPELVRCSTPPHQPQQQQQLHPNEGAKHSSDCDPSQSCSRLSSYDNVERNLSFFLNGIDSAQSDDGTVFSEPWDSQWDATGQHDDTTLNSDTIHLSKCRAVVSEDDTIIEELNTKETNEDTLKAKKTNGRLKVATILRSPSMRDREILCHPRNKINAIGATGAGDSLGDYTLQLAQDQTSTFARNIENFISCTKESREAAPQVVMRNMRQFMNGMKNYLVKHGEGKFHQEVESARSRLKSDEFLNLDAILERVMHQLVVLPLREHLYGMFVDYYTRSEDIQLLAQNVKYACGRDAVDFGIRAAVTPPSPTSLMAISNLLLRLQEAELPLDKLDLFLTVISTIFEATGCPRGQQLGADDFLPVLVYVVAKCGFVGAEIEAEFMWGLLQPTLLNGEPGYYLTALCSAVHVLKSFMSSEGENGTGSLDWRSSSLPACSSVLRVIIPDECNGSLQTRTLPVRPNTTTREVCRIIALKARITNPQDYALFKLVDGEETLLNDVECPQDIRLSTRGKHCMLAYKRIDAKIAWPTAQSQHHSASNGY